LVFEKKKSNWIAHTGKNCKHGGAYTHIGTHNMALYVKYFKGALKNSIRNMSRKKKSGVFYYQVLTNFSFF
jgi:hypothetical protein